MHTNNADGERWLSFWAGNTNSPVSDTPVAFAMIPVKPTEVGTTTVTYNYPTYAGYTSSKTEEVAVGTTLVAPAVDFFTATGLQGGTTATGAEMSVNVTGTWNFPFELDHVYRMHLRNTSNTAYCNGSQIKTNDAAASAFVPGGLMYLHPEGFSNNLLQVSIRSIALGENEGLIVGTESNTSKTDDITGTLGENPTHFYVVATTSGNDGINLRHPDNDNIHLNDINGVFGGWKHGNSKNNDGSFLRFTALTDADWENNSWNYQGVTIDFDETAKANAQANPTPENLRTLFAVPARMMGTALYQNTVGIDYTKTDGTVNVPGYAAASNAKALYDVLVNEDSTDDEIIAKIAALNDASPAYAYVPTEGAIYTMVSTDGDVRGYLCNYNGAMTNTSASAATFDADSEDFHFVFVTVDGKQYLYNLGAQNFMNAFGEKTDNTWHDVRDNADYTWRFSDVATEIKALICFQSAKPHSLTISAGLTPVANSNFSGTHEGGLSMTDSGTRPNIVSMGITNRGDGNGLYLAYVGKLSNEKIEELQKKAQSAINKANNDAAIAKSITEDQEGAGKTTVNSFTYATACAIPDDAEPDHKHYILNAEGARHGITLNHVYTLEAPGGEFCWGLKDDEIALTNEEGAKECKWQAVAGENGEILLQHNIEYNNEPAEANIALLATDTKVLTLGSVVPSDEHGLVELSGANAPGKYKMIWAGENAADATTVDIAEITVDGPVANGVIYDLQGRRLSAPVKGINIINGKKILVK